MTLVNDYAGVIAIAVVLLLVALFFLLRPKQKVRLTDSAPVRPHMVSAQDKPAPSPFGILKTDGERVAAGPKDATHPGEPDHLLLLKGVGPKLEALLHSLGFYHFDQIAGWTAAEIAWVDENLEGFKGRVTRDEWVAQARDLARGLPPRPGGEG